MTSPTEKTPAAAPRAHRLPTFSGLPRWLACQLTDVLPQVDTPSPYRALGSARHAFLQKVTEILATPRSVDTQAEDGGVVTRTREHTLEEARELALAEAPEEHQAILAAIPLESLGLSSVASEVALALDLETGEARELGRGLDRDYPAVRDTEIVGTTDRLGLVGTDGLYIGDYKGRSHKTPPDQDPQLLAAALAGSRVYGRVRAQLEVIRDFGGEIRAQAGTVDLVALDSFEIRLQDRRALMLRNREAHAANPLDLPEGEVGPHCSYCPSMRFCPAQMAIARAALGADSDELLAIQKVGAAYIDEASAPRLHALVGQAEKLLEVVKEGLKNYARQSPFQLADGSGRWYGVPLEAKERELGDGEQVRLAISQLFGVDPAARAVKVEASFSGVEAAVKHYLALHPELAKRGAIKDLVGQAEEELKKRGLMVVRVGGQVKVHKRSEK